jgi:Flp pilus assembly protein TadD
VASSLARANLNLGVMQAQGEHLDEAIAFFETAAGLDPDLPGVQSSLGIALFTDRQFDKARDHLSRALATAPGDRRLGRALAMACLQSQDYAKAAELLRADPDRAGDPSLQFAYGLALARSGRASEAEAILTALVRERGETPELLEALREVRAHR